MKIVTKMVVLAGLMGLVGCVSGSKPRDPNNPGSAKPGDNQMPPPVTRISPEEVNEQNAPLKALELYRILSAEIEQSSNPTQLAERQ